ncbi:hypothetical protein B0A55_08951, partial [Friedmanniomyces simplex]
MDTYQKPLEDVDAALKRLNATLASYKVASTTKPAPAATAPMKAPAPAATPANKANGNKTSIPATRPAPASKNGQQSNGHPRSAGRTAEPTGPGSNPAESPSDLPQVRPDLLWQEAMKLRFCDRSSRRTMMLGPDFPGMSGDQFAIDRQIDDIMMLQEHYLVDYPYLLPIRLLTAQKYLQLGYPDLAAGEAYKALLLCDAVRDPSDDYHQMAAPQLR